MSMNQMKQQMQLGVEAYKDELAGIRTGRGTQDC